MNPNLYKFYDALTYCSPIILLLGVILGLVYFSRLERVYRLLLLFLVMSLVIDITSRLVGRFYQNNLILIPIYGLFELLILSRVYIKYLKIVKNSAWYFVIGALVVYNIYEIINLFNVEPKDFNSHSRVFDSLALVVMSIVFYIKQIVDDIPARPGFLFLNTVIFAFHSLNLILYLPINFLINENSDVKFHFWYASLVITLVFYSSIIRMIWKHGKNHKP